MGMFLGLYAGVMLLVTVATDRSNVGNALISIAFGVAVALAVLVILAKFGWTMPIMRSREELAQQRAERQATRGRKSGGSSAEPVLDGPRPKAAPTSRTTTGPSQRKKTANKRR
jgi:hypothetical protein